MAEIRICQFFKLQTTDGVTHRYQNYFVAQTAILQSESYFFAPFRAEGAIASLNGENNILQILFPNLDISVAMLYAGDGNRLSTLELTTVWLTADGSYTNNVQVEHYVGVGSSISDTTLELRFRSAIDSVTSNFPNRILTRELVGPLPLDSQLVLQ